MEKYDLNSNSPYKQDQTIPLNFKVLNHMIKYLKTH